MTWAAGVGRTPIFTDLTITVGTTNVQSKHFGRKSGSADASHRPGHDPAGGEATAYGPGKDGTARRLNAIHRSVSTLARLSPSTWATAALRMS